MPAVLENTDGQRIQGTKQAMGFDRRENNVLDAITLLLPNYSAVDARLPKAACSPCQTQLRMSVWRGVAPSFPKLHVSSKLVKATSLNPIARPLTRSHPVL